MSVSGAGLFLGGCYLVLRSLKAFIAWLGSKRTERGGKRIDTAKEEI